MGRKLLKQDVQKKLDELHEIIVEIASDIAGDDHDKEVMVAEEILSNIADVLGAAITERRDIVESSKVVAKHITSLYAVIDETLVKPIFLKENFLDL
jgi:hypothetical protein